MKPPPAAAGLKDQFNRASEAIEARFGDKPVWVKLVVFVPVLIALTAVLVFLVYMFSIGAMDLTRLFIHR